MRCLLMWLLFRRLLMRLLFRRLLMRLLSRRLLMRLLPLRLLMRLLPLRLLFRRLLMRLLPLRYHIARRRTRDRRVIDASGGGTIGCAYRREPSRTIGRGQRPLNAHVMRMAVIDRLQVIAVLRGDADMLLLRAGHRVMTLARPGDLVLVRARAHASATAVIAHVAPVVGVCAAI